MRSGHGVFRRIRLGALALVAVLAVGCDYIVLPEDLNTGAPALADRGWSGIVTAVSEAGGSLHVDLSIVNNTNDWSAMDVAASKAKVADASGASHDCATVFVGTSVLVNSGGWYLPPGFAMSGYTGGSLASPTTQRLYVECSGVTNASGQTLTVAYTYIAGAFNYYVPAHPKTASMTLSLDKVVTDTTYPVASKVATLTVEKPGATIPAINGCTVQLTAVKRTATGFEFDWESENPTNYPAYVHIGQPPVIGADGILYGFYQSPHLADVPITPAKDKATWTTKIAAPKDVSGFYLLVPVETQQQKYFVDHVVDITDK